VIKFALIPSGVIPVFHFQSPLLAFSVEVKIPPPLKATTPLSLVPQIPLC